MNNLWKKYLFLSTLFGVLFFAIFVLLGGSNVLDGDRTGGFYHHILNFIPNSNSASTANTSRKLNSATLFSSNNSNNSNSLGATMVHLDSNPIKLNNITVGRDSRDEHSNSNLQPNSQHSQVSASRPTVSRNYRVIGNYDPVIHPVSGSGSKSDKFSLHTRSYTNRMLASSSPVRTSTAESTSAFMNSDLLANNRQSVGVLPGTGGDATTADAVPLDNGYWILLLMSIAKLLMHVNYGKIFEKYKK